MSELTKPNLILSFKIGIGFFSVDPSGNEVEANRVLTVFASVKRDSSPEFYQMPGVKPTDVGLKGKVTTSKGLPAKLPEGINYESSAIAELTEDGKILKGRFRLIPVIQSRLSALTDNFGERISGIMQITGL